MNNNKFLKNNGDTVSGNCLWAMLEHVLERISLVFVHG
jgi:hypothetical protein